jgi:nucleotide-binding universal stress UspA family protein
MTSPGRADEAVTGGRAGDVRLEERAMEAHRQPLQTILVATDFSQDAAAALGWAAKVARVHSAKIVLVHAAAVVAPIGLEFVPLDERVHAEVREQARRELALLAGGLRGSGLDVEWVLTEDPIAGNLLAEAEKHGADLIVAGTRGLTGWKKVVLGSVAARLVRKALCPVVTVHADDAARERPLRTILVPTDFSEDSMRAASAASRILGGIDPERRIVLLHVYRYPLEFVPSSEPVLAHSIDEVVDSARRAMAALAERLGQAGLHVDSCVREGAPWEVILDQAAKVDADLIAMGTHGRSGLERLFLGSTAERVLSAAPCPILTVGVP